jgi:hypothetical protein
MVERWVCIVSEAVAKKWRITIAFKCPGGNHAHLTRRQVDAMESMGDLSYVGDHKRVAVYTTHRTWQKVASGLVHCMQLVAGNRGR